MIDDVDVCTSQWSSSGTACAVKTLKEAEMIGMCSIYGG